MTAQPHKVQQLKDDGLLTSRVRDYAQEKYSLVKLYCHLFTTGMRNRWDELVYLDLFAGPGRGVVEGTNRILPGSPILALDLEHPFDRYVFCEANAKSMEALRQRVARDFSGQTVEYVRGDVNESVDAVLDAIPSGSKAHRVLSFCFADPYSMRNLRFRTLEQLSERFMDFLVLIPTGYDATRNWEQRYTSRGDRTVEEFLGDSAWRREWEMSKSKNQSVDTFLTNAFGASMVELGYKYPGIGDTHLIRLTEKNVGLYRLAFFSTHALGTRFWRQVRKYATDQRSFLS